MRSLYVGVLMTGFLLSGMANAQDWKELESSNGYNTYVSSQPIIRGDRKMALLSHAPLSATGRPQFKEAEVLLFITDCGGHSTIVDTGMRDTTRTIHFDSSDLDRYATEPLRPNGPGWIPNLLTKNLCG
jgi:hypothetical protein